MKKLIATIATIMILSVSGAQAWQFDINVDGLDISVGEDGVDVDIDTYDGDN